ncbi:MAG: hypothetical protein F4Z88_08625, partial [Chloroflexi bacterium]|nr:hypothetical protein [Chloroflexota bacterium]
MIRMKSVTKRFLSWIALGVMLFALMLTGCTGDRGSEGPENGDRAPVSESVERGEHGSGGEGSGGESGSEGSEAGGAGSEEASGATLAPDQTFDAVRGGARLGMNYDAA